MSLFNPNIKAAAEAAKQAAPVLSVVVPRLPGLGGDDVLAMSSAVKPSARFTPPARMQRPFVATQASTLEYSLRSIADHGGVLIGDEPGMGKTQVMLALVDHFTADGGYAIMVAPPVAKAGYLEDLKASFPHLRFAHLQGRKVYAKPDADVYFMTDDALTLRHWLTSGSVKDDKGREHLVVNDFARNARILTRDELHRDKGDMGKPSLRAKVMLAVSKVLHDVGTPVVGATGTLLTNRPVEAFLPLQIIGGERLVKLLTPGAKSLAGFLYRYTMPVEKYVRGRKVTDFTGADTQHLVELNDYLRRTVYPRHLREDSGIVLPHGGWLVKPVALNGALDHYNDLVERFLPTLFATEGKLAAERAARAEQLVKVMKIWEEAGVAKAKMAVEYIADLVDQGRKVVAFYHHTEVFDRLAAGFIDAGITTAVINGQVTGDHRVTEIERFQNGNAQVMLANIKAAGMAVTLTAAADAVFVQVPWSAGDLQQAASRILRIDDRSQARAAAGESVTWHVLQASQPDGRTTFDQVLWQVLENKAHVVDAVNQGHDIIMPEGSVIESVMEAWYQDMR